MPSHTIDSSSLSNVEAFDQRGHQAAIAFEETARALDLEPWIVERLRHPDVSSTTFLPLVRGNGDPLCVPLFQVRHGGLPGATIGSLSLVPDLQLADCEATAMERTWQAALLQLPVLGASYGLVCDGEELNEGELLRLMRLAARGVRSTAPSILFPGRNCARECLGAFAAEITPEQHVVVSGRPEYLGGLDLAAFQAEGVATVVLQLLQDRGIAATSAKVVVQGYRKAGRAISARLSELGLTLAGLSDGSGAIYRSDGFILGDIHAQVESEEVLFGYREAERISAEAMLQAEGDVLVLASSPHEVHSGNWRKLSAPIVVEAVWDGVSPAAKKQLADAGHVVVPWSLATCGAVLGAYLEGRGEHPFRSLEQLLQRTHELVQQTYARVAAYSAVHAIPLDDAARHLAVERVAAAIRTCGF